MDFGITTPKASMRDSTPSHVERLDIWSVDNIRWKTNIGQTKIKMGLILMP